MKHSILLLFSLLALTMSAQQLNGDFKLYDPKEISIVQLHHQELSPFLLIQFTSEFETKFERKIPIVRKLNNGYVIIESTNLKDFSEAEIHKAYLINDQWKWNSRALQMTNSAEKVSFLIKTNTENAVSIEQAFRSSAIKFTKRSSLLYEVISTKNKLEQTVLRNSSVTYIGLESQLYKPESIVRDMDLSVNQINILHREQPDLTGENKVLSIKEPLYDVTDIDITGRHIPSNLQADIVDQHATDMATISGGAGNSFVTGHGVADAVNFISSSVENLFPDPDSYFTNENITVQNHSYGTQIENFYGALAEAYDQSAVDNPELLHIFSVGNSAALTPEDGQYAGLTGFSTITGNFKQAKNILTIGAVDTLNTSVSFSSKGPSYDGRIKPELVAYTTVGTSNSAALTSGIAILLQQQYERQNGSIPNADLIKAVLINSAEDIGTKGPDYTSGYGNVNALKSFETIASDRFTRGSVSQNDTEEIFITVPANTAALKVTLVWTDRPATVNSTTALVNDLDLKGQAADNTITLPWVLNTNPDAAALNEPASRGEDHLNTIEQLFVETPAIGSYTIQVTGSSISSGVQDYAIAYEIIPENEFKWTFPTSADNYSLNGETSGYFRWVSSFENVTGDLDISFDGGVSWESMAPGLELSANYFQANFPAEKSGIAIARMTINGMTYLTEEFVISPAMQVEPGYVCDEEVLLTWKPVPNVIDYTVYTIADNNLSPISTTTDTTYVFQANSVTSSLFAVRPNFSSELSGVGSPTINYTDFATPCYINSFFALLLNENEVELSLSLGTLEGIREIIVERAVLTDFEQIESTTSPSGTQLMFIDSAPFEGQNVYRVRLVLDNGQEVISELASIFFFRERDVLLFPNPALLSEGVNVFTRPLDDDEELTVKFYDLLGRSTFYGTITSDRDFIDFSDSSLSAGTYFYSIQGKDWASSGTIVVQ